MDSIQKLIEEDFLFVDYRTPAVILSSHLHLAFIDDEMKKQRVLYRLFRWMGWMVDDYRYFKLMENIRSYINMLRASNGMNRFTDDKPLPFRVSSTDKKSILLEGAHVGRKIVFN
ncbi:MAG: hypothetical protein ACI36Z_09985 [Alloprevotella sp.]